MYNLDMKFLAIILCKILKKIGKMAGRGSSLPGQFALKICPDMKTGILRTDIIERFSYDYIWTDCIYGARHAEGIA